MQNDGRNLALIICKFYANDLLKFQTKFLLDVVSGVFIRTFYFYYPCQNHLDHSGNNKSIWLIINSLDREILMYTTQSIAKLLKMYFNHILLSLSMHFFPFWIAA